MKKNKINILDCTLRDGGYVNNWEFETKTAKNIIEGLYKSGVRHIELGLLGEGGIPGNSTKFANFDQLKPLLENKNQDCSYALLINQADAKKFEIPFKDENTVDLIRIAYFKNELPDALIFAEELKNKGYKVFMQAMATFLYSDEELVDMIMKINEVNPTAFYIVDSFGNMYPEDIRSLTNKVLAVLNENIEYGLHAHNNIQMGYANVIEFLSTSTSRNLYVDGSIYGMGRGAGNVPIELIMEYLNKKERIYNITTILEVYQNELSPIFAQYFWGYTHPYYITASRDTNSVYSWYFTNNGITDVALLVDAIDSVSNENKYTLVRSEAQEILNNIKMGGK